MYDMIRWTKRKEYNKYLILVYLYEAQSFPGRAVWKIKSSGCKYVNGLYCSVGLRNRNLLRISTLRLCLARVEMGLSVPEWSAPTTRAQHGSFAGRWRRCLDCGVGRQRLFANVPRACFAILTSMLLHTYPHWRVATTTEAPDAHRGWTQQ